jgi:hypothetical protein
MPAKKRLTETAPKMCHLECKVNYDGFVKIQKPKRYASYKQRVAELGTSFSWHFSRTTNMMTSSITLPYLQRKHSGSRAWPAPTGVEG